MHTVHLVTLQQSDGVWLYEKKLFWDRMWLNLNMSNWSCNGTSMQDANVR